VHRPAVDRDHRAGGSGQIRRAVQVNLGVVRSADRAGPGALLVAMHEDRPLVAARDAGQRPLLRRHVIEIDAERHRAVIGVRPSRDVLVPIDDLARAGVFVVELARVEFDVGTDQIGGDVGERRLGADPPEIGVSVDERAQPADMRAVGAVPRADVEFLVRGGNAPALFDELAGAGAQHLLPFVGDQPLGGEKTLREILHALLLAQHARRLGNDRFGRHKIPSLSFHNSRLAQRVLAIHSASGVAMPH
jgi:hypothetical protein